MKMAFLDTKGNKAGEITLKKEIFEVEPNLELLAQSVRVHLFNRRQGNSATKTRAQVSGSGAKPWSQKGTGRARVGDKRNPLWTHGGISHGPQPKSWSLNLSKNQKRAALLSALSLKAKEGKFIVVENLDILKGKTSDAANFLKDIKVERNILFLFDLLNSKIKQSLSNLKNVELSDAGRVNAYQLISAAQIVATKNAIVALEKKLLKEEK